MNSEPKSELTVGPFVLALSTSACGFLTRARRGFSSTSDVFCFFFAGDDLLLDFLLGLGLDLDSFSFPFALDFFVDFSFFSFSFSFSFTFSFFAGFCFFGEGFFCREERTSRD